MWKLRIASLSLLTFCMVAFPATAQTIYDNGPINGTTDAWTINFGFVVSNSFTYVCCDNITALSFGAWLFPGDTLTSAEVSITSDEFGGTTYFDGVVSFTESGCSLNQFGYNVCTETGSFNPGFLVPGTYWLNLSNAVAGLGDDPVYWDENSGPSSASENSVGTIPSEAFSILGNEGTTTSSTSVPEPSGIVLVGSGIFGLAGFLRRKLF